MEEARWTLDELAERVDAALAVGYHGQSSGRVRDVPDRRAIRWYTTIGLIDRPVAHRGRTAMYGPRHLLQLVAVKRLQAKGLPLVAIQQELAGATDSQLARVARLPSPVPAPAAPGPKAAVARARRADFWRGQPAALAAAAPTPYQAAHGIPSDRGFLAGREAADPGAAPTAGASPGEVAAGAAATLRGIRLGGGATLLLEPGRELDAADLHAILDAARPLVAALGDRGLAGPPTPPQGSGRGRGNDQRREHP